MSENHIPYYDECITNISKYIDTMKEHRMTYTAFDGSIALAVCFNLPKQKTLKDLLKYREK